jgi:hypothetical protein
MKEKIIERSAHREALIYHLRVFDAESNHVVGYVDDINTEGVKLLCEDPIPTNTVSKYRLELPRFFEGKKSVEFVARTAWSDGDDASKVDYYDCGVKFIDLEPQGRERISQLISGYHM